MRRGIKTVAAATALSLAACSGGEAESQIGFEAEMEPVLGNELILPGSEMPGIAGRIALENGCLLELDENAPHFISERLDLSDEDLRGEEIRPDVLNPHLGLIDKHISEDFRAGSVDVLVNWSGCEWRDQTFDATAYHDPYIGISTVQVVTNSELQPLPEEFYESVVNHENAHIFFAMIGQMGNYEEEAFQRTDKFFYSWAALVGDKKEGGEEALVRWLNDPEDYRPLPDVLMWDVGLETDENGLPVEYDGSVMSVLDESSYIGLEGGHPYDNPDELFASTLNISLKFPNELMGAIGTLDGDRQKLAKDIVKEVAGLFVDYSAAGREAALAEFSPEFIEYFGIE